jgi:hypothetical protein
VLTEADVEAIAELDRAYEQLQHLGWIRHPEFEGGWYREGDGYYDEAAIVPEYLIDRLKEEHNANRD